MRDAADMPELQEDPPALGVHGVGDLAPAVDLRLGVDAGRVLIALALLRDLGGLGDEQAGRRALAVVRGGEIAGHQPGAGAVARQRRHHGPVGNVIATEPVGLEQLRCGLVGVLMRFPE